MSDHSFFFSFLNRIKIQITYPQTIELSNKKITKDKFCTVKHQGNMRFRDLKTLI